MLRGRLIIPSKTNLKCPGPQHETGIGLLVITHRKSSVSLVLHHFHVAKPLSSALIIYSAGQREALQTAHGSTYHKRL